MTQEIIPTTEEGQHLAHILRVLNRAKFKIGDSVTLTREGRREIGFRFEDREHLLRKGGKIKEVKVHIFVRGERKYPDEPFYIVEFEGFEIDIWERFLKKRISIYA